MTKTQAAITVSITMNAAVQHLAAIHRCSEQAIADAVTAGNLKVIDQLCSLINRFEQSIVK
jgi:hypothetical protein